MALSTIREQIKVILASVSGIGVVHEYERFSDTWTKFLDLFKDENDKINGWTISRKSSSQTEFAQGNDLGRLHRFILTGFYGLQDGQATELKFQDLIEAIVTKFNSYNNLNGTCFSISPEPGETSGIQVDIVENRIIGNFLCHYTELSLYVQEI